MIVQIKRTTDGKFVGSVVNIDTFSFCEDWEFNKCQDLGGGYYRYSNSNYVVEVKEIKDKKWQKL